MASVMAWSVRGQQPRDGFSLYDSICAMASAALKGGKAAAPETASLSARGPVRIQAESSRAATIAATVPSDTAVVI